MFRVLKILFLILLITAPMFAQNYNGSGWDSDQCRYYNGSSWVDCDKHYYGGSSWTQIETAGEPVTWAMHWSGENVGGTLLAEQSGGGTITGTLVANGTISTVQALSPTHSFLRGAGDATSALWWAFTEGVDFDQDEGEFEIHIYIPSLALISDDGIIWHTLAGGSYNSQNHFWCDFNSSGNVYFRREANDVRVSVSASGALVTDQDNEILFRWSVTNNLISINVNGAGWVNDSDEVNDVVAMVVTQNGVCLGSIANGWAGSEHYLDDMYTVVGYDPLWNGE